MAKEYLLVVEDEEDLVELLQYNLKKEGYRVEAVMTGEAALDAVRGLAPSLVLLDLMLPGVSGLEVCRRLKSDERTRAIPVIMLTARGEESDIVVGLELGADDYVTKPFSPKVLVSRIRAVLRRHEQHGEPSEATLTLGDLVIDPRRHEVLVDRQPVALTATEFRVLHFLARRPGWVFTREQIVDAVHGDDYPVTDRAIDVHMVSLRRKLGSCSDDLETVRGIGYRFKD